MQPKMPMKMSASLKVDERNVLTRSTDAIPDAADGVDEGIALLAVDLAAHPPDIDVDDVGAGVEMEIPYVLQQHGARHHLAFVANEKFQHLELARQHVDASARAAHRSRHEIELEIADPEHRLL